MIQAKGQWCQKNLCPIIITYGWNLWPTSSIRLPSYTHNTYWLLKHSLYGLRQDPWHWFGNFSKNPLFDWSDSILAHALYLIWQNSTWNTLVIYGCIYWWLCLFFVVTSCQKRMQMLPPTTNNCWLHGNGITLSWNNIQMAWKSYQNLSSHL